MGLPDTDFVIEIRNAVLKGSFLFILRFYLRTAPSVVRFDLLQILLVLLQFCKSVFEFIGFLFCSCGKRSENILAVSDLYRYQFHLPINIKLHYCNCKIGHVYLQFFLLELWQNNAQQRIRHHQRWPRGEPTRHSPCLARLVASEAEPGPETRATRRASVGRPALVHERGGSLALVSEGSNDVASPHLPRHSQRNVQIFCPG